MKNIVLYLFNAVFGTILVMTAVDPNPVLILADCSSHYYLFRTFSL